MSNLIAFLENLNLREKILFAILLGFLGIFLAFKLYESFSGRFLEEIIGLNGETLLERKSQIKHLENVEKNLKIELKEQNLKLEEGLGKIAFFSKNYEDYLDFIELLSRKHHLLINHLQNTYKDEKLLQKHFLDLELSGDFLKLLLFIYELENSNFAFKFESIELQNAKALSLSLHLNLTLITLK
ncbi:hypothetical protein KJQ83_08075 [Campylobacter upsaliensis]|uniref:hypothetical protein n=1 Tax=Campylobacter upsaliensis TaxID=28080 RepID=UPI00128687AA|nr:hypothetical protein [Campylobacter upsaliensis]EAJ7577453.1 hypothetical protein [Campylobacter upsaliensis]ECV9714290.1 hypothetical protein [Campylobacter upsaliensis]MBT0757158.1 hypothetical protein [Campylobacter upsaliensis]